jgi:hypothetical protein
MILGFSAAIAGDIRLEHARAVKLVIAAESQRLADGNR